ncbi:MAG: hypothetical protein ACRDO1_03260 [Nocardioidaceae bacterium]
MTEQTTDLHRVQVWFGDHVICTHDAEEALACRYALAMQRRFPGLRITDDPLTGHETVTAAAELPSELLWPLTVQ